MVTGWHVYSSTDPGYTEHDDCFLSGKCWVYDEDHLANANSARTYFEVDDTGYFNATADANVYFAHQKIWDEFGNHTVQSNAWRCTLINGANATRATPWDYSSLNATNNIVVAQQWVIHSTDFPCYQSHLSSTTEENSFQG